MNLNSEKNESIVGSTVSLSFEESDSESDPNSVLVKKIDVT
jgi:hypothetical protein